MKRLFPFFVLMLLWAGCEEECPPTNYSITDYTSNGSDSNEMIKERFMGTWRYAYSVLKCDYYEPQGWHTFVYDTLFSGDSVSWMTTLVPIQSVIIHDVITVLKNDVPIIYCIENWYQEIYEPNNSNFRNSLRIRGENLFFVLNSTDTLEIDTLLVGPSIEVYSPCGSNSYSTSDYYVRVQ